MRKHPILGLLIIFILVGLACNANPFASEEATEEPPTEEPQPADTVEPTPIPEPTDTPTPEPSPTPELKSAEEILDASNMAMDEVESFHFVMDMQLTMGGEGLSMEIPMSFEGDVQSPDKVAGTLSLSFLGISMDSEIITIGDTTYMTDPETGEWQVSTGDELFGLDQFAGGINSPESFIDPQEEAFSELEVVGEETLNGIPVIHLTGSMMMDEIGGDGVFDVDIWFGAEDNYLYQMVIEGTTTMEEIEDSPFGAGGGELEMVITITLSDYGKEVLIEAPENVSEISDVTGIGSGFFGEPIQSVAFSADGQYLASAGNDGNIYLWDTETGGEAIAVLPGHTDWVRSVAFSPDGSWLASGSDDLSVLVWSIEDPSTLPEILFGHEDWVRSVAFSPDSQTLATGSDDSTIRLWDMGDLSADPTILETGGYVYSVAFSPDGSSLASGGDEGLVYVWDLTDPNADPTILEGHSDWVRSVAFSPDGRYLASGSDDTTVLLWEVDALEQGPETLAGHTDWVRAVAFSPDGLTLASAGDDLSILLWDLTDMSAAPAVLFGHEDWILSVAFSPDGSQLASGAEDGTTRLWPLETPGEFVILGAE